MRGGNGDISDLSKDLLGLDYLKKTPIGRIFDQEGLKAVFFAEKIPGLFRAAFDPTSDDLKQQIDKLPYPVLQFDASHRSSGKKEVLF